MLISTGLLGLIAAFALTVEKFRVLEDLGAELGCDFSVIVQCGANLGSAQGAVFGFPNPLIGLIGFTAVVMVGVAVAAGARLARWFWLGLNLGVALAMAFVLWLIGQSIYSLGTLCPWCMLVWAVTIPLFLAVTLDNVRAGVIPLPRRVSRALSAAYEWIPLISVLGYLAILVLAQLRLDLLAYL